MKPTQTVDEMLPPYFQSMACSMAMQTCLLDCWSRWKLSQYPLYSNGLLCQGEVTLWFLEQCPSLNPYRQETLDEGCSRPISGSCKCKIWGRDFLRLCFEDSISQMLSIDALLSCSNPIRELWYDVVDTVEAAYYFCCHVWCLATVCAISILSQGTLFVVLFQILISLFATSRFQHWCTELSLSSWRSSRTDV